MSAISGALLGLLKTALQEYPMLDCRLVDTDNNDDIAKALAIKEPIQAYCSLPPLAIKEPIQAYYSLLPLAGEGARRADEGRRVYVHRLTTPNKLGELTLPDDAYALVKSNNNTLEGLTLELQTPHELQDHTVEIAVCATGLNFRDILNALGLYPGDPGPLGGEVAGIVTRVGHGVKAFKPGDAVFGMSAGGFRSYALTHEMLITQLPPSLSFAEAAGLPIVYLTAYEALIQIAKIKRGDKVLIHAGTGGVGIAAIQLAKHIGAEIYATASESKQAYLRSIGIQHIYNSRTTAFGNAILADTHNQGVDVILNSLTSEGFIAASLSCLKQDGIFIEIAKRNIYTREQMQHDRADVDYHIIAIDDMAQTNPQRIQVMLREISNLLEKKKIHPLPITTYPLEQVKTAFMTMQKAKHIGKIIVVQPRLLVQTLDANANYLITGGLGGLGLLTAKWLVQHGAKHIVLVSRSKPNAEKQAIIDALDADIAFIPTDMGNKNAVVALIKTIHEKRVLKGIFHLAGVLDDGVIAEQTPERFKTVFSPKANAAQYLHEATQQSKIKFRLLCDVFIDCIQHGIAWSSQLCSSKWVFRSTGIGSTQPRLSCNQYQLGTMGDCRHGCNFSS